MMMTETERRTVEHIIREVNRDDHKKSSWATTAVIQKIVNSIERNEKK